MSTTSNSIKEHMIKEAWGKKQFSIALAFRSAEARDFPAIVEEVLKEIVGNRLYCDDDAVVLFDLFRRSLFCAYDSDYKTQTGEIIRILKYLPENHFVGGPGPDYQIDFPKLKDQIVGTLCYFNLDASELVRFFLSINPKHGQHVTRKFWEGIIRKSLGVNPIEFDSLMSLAGEFKNSLLYEAVVETLSITRIKYFGANTLVDEARARLANNGKTNAMLVGETACYI